MAYIMVHADSPSFVEPPSYLGAPPQRTNPAPPTGPGAQRNLLDAFEDMSEPSLLLPAPSAKETVAVFLRVKPKTLEESEISQEERENDGDDRESGATVEPVVIESEHQIALHAPKESNTYKNSMNGAGKLTHR